MTTLLGLYLMLSLLGLVIGIAKKLVGLVIFAGLMLLFAFVAFGGLVFLIGCM